MRNVYLFSILLFGFFCSFAQSPSPSGRLMTPDDPNLDPSWDWTQVVPNQGHLMYYLPPGGSITQTYAQTPFRKNGEDFFVYDETIADMYQEDGWMLVYRDFGTPTNAPTIPFFALYNRYKGLLRVFALNTPGNRDSFYEMKLLFRSGSPKPAIFTFADSDPSKRFLDNFNSSGVLRYIGVTTPGGWYYGEFNIAGYDPNISSSTVFSIKLDGINASRIQLSGSLVAQGSITLEGIIKGTGNLSGYYPSTSNNSVSFLNKGEKYFSSGAKLFEALNKIKSKKGDQGLLAAASFIPKVGPVIGAIGAVLSFVNTFIGGNDDGAAKEPISFNLDLTQDAAFRGDITLEGTLNLSGIIETSLPVWSADFAMSGDNSTPALYKPVQTIPWGVLNLKSSALQTIITRETIGSGSYWTAGNNCYYVCPCGYQYVYEEQFVWQQCQCAEYLECDQIEIFYPIFDRDYKHKIRFLYNPSLGMTVTGVKLIYSGIDYNLAMTTISSSEIELTTPTLNYNYYDIQGSDPFSNTTSPTHIVFFLKINSPVRNADDEVVIIEKIKFSNESVSYNIGGRIATFEKPEITFEKIDLEKPKPASLVNYPNPIANFTRIEFAVEEESSVGNLRVIDLNGKLIKSIISNQPFKKGRYRMFWDGKDAMGQSAPDGIYVCQFYSGEKMKSIRIMKSH
jgi:hypothetical protein